MSQAKLKIMTVDDDVINLEILEKNLKDSGYKAVPFEDPEQAWTYLNNNPQEIDLILLDKMMPKMSGLEMLRRIKAHDSLKNIPVIMQTADIGSEQTKEGLDSGAYYYLEKPFDPSVMVSLVNAASRDYIQKNSVLDTLKKEKTIAKIMLDGRFRYKTSTDAKKLAAALAYHSENPGEMGIALSEIMVNSVEHGNLEIGYENKNMLMAENRFDEEVNKRLSSAEYKNKTVCVRYQRDPENVVITISDEGKGFDSSKFLEFDPLRLTDLNGRGIATANLMGLKLEYQNNGSTVICSYKTSAVSKED